MTSSVPLCMPAGVLEPRAELGGAAPSSSGAPALTGCGPAGRGAPRRRVAGVEGAAFALADVALALGGVCGVAFAFAGVSGVAFALAGVFGVAFAPALALGGVSLAAFGFVDLFVAAFGLAGFPRPGFTTAVSCAGTSRRPPIRAGRVLGRLPMTPASLAFSLRPFGPFPSFELTGRNSRGDSCNLSSRSG